DRRAHQSCGRKAARENTNERGCAGSSPCRHKSPFPPHLCAGKRPARLVLLLISPQYSLCLDAILCHEKAQKAQMRFPLTLPADKPFDAVGFGLNAVDHLIVVPEYPAFDTKMRLLEHKQSAGGQTATAMVALRRLGLKTAYAGRFGSDQEGVFGLKTLKDDDVNVEFAEVVEGARTQIAFITVDARSGERTIVWDRDERLAY